MLGNLAGNLAVGQGDLAGDLAGGQGDVAESSPDLSLGARVAIRRLFMSRSDSVVTDLRRLYRVLATFFETRLVFPLVFTVVVSSIYRRVDGSFISSLWQCF